jgi:hypothetical protein
MATDAGMNSGFARKYHEFRPDRLASDCEGWQENLRPETGILALSIGKFSAELGIYSSELGIAQRDKCSQFW